MINLVNFINTMSIFYTNTLTERPYNLYNLSHQLAYDDNKFDNDLTNEVMFIINNINRDILNTIPLNKKIFILMNYWQYTNLKVNTLDESNFILNIMIKYFSINEKISNDYYGFHINNNFIEKLNNRYKRLFINENKFSKLITDIASKIEVIKMYTRGFRANYSFYLKPDYIKYMIKWLCLYEHCKYLIGKESATKILYLQARSVSYNKQDKNTKDYIELKKQFKIYGNLYEYIDNIQ